jgi:hypothetical protein
MLTKSLAVASVHAELELLLNIWIPTTVAIPTIIAPRTMRKSCYCPLFVSAQMNWIADYEKKEAGE